MKRLGLLLYILTSLMTAACGQYSPNEGIPDVDVDFENGGMVTIYLDGKAPVPSPRSLSRPLAVLAHDFFEVVFIYNTGSGLITARGTWELGEGAGVNGVYRTDDGVDYGAAISGSPGANSGTAILFAGKKTDKTLLAVGSLSAVDGDPAERTIKNDTTAVSFELNALRAGTDKAPALSSFWTSNPGGATPTAANTIVGEVPFNNRNFPMYRLVKDATYQAQYRIDVHSTSHPYSTYGNGIILAPNLPPPAMAMRFENVRPHYTSNGDVWDNDADPVFKTLWYHPASPALITLNNNTGNSGVFNRDISFTLNTNGAPDQGIFSLVFHIPVYAINADADPVRWFIKPGFDNYCHELDNGAGSSSGNGGAVFISIGTFTVAVGYELAVKKEPKTQYNPGNPNPTTGFIFNIDKILLEFQTKGGRFIASVDKTTEAEYFINRPGPGYIDIETDPGAWAAIKATGYYHAATNPTGKLLTSGVTALSQVVPPIDKIWVHYTSGAGFEDTVPYISPNDFYAFYEVSITNVSIDFDGLDDRNRIVVASWLDFNNLAARIFADGGSGTYLAVLTDSFDLVDITINITGPVTIAFTATRPGIVIGRSGTTGSATGGVTIWGGDASNVTFYFGTWPVDEPVIVGGDVLVNYPFYVNAGGSYEDWPMLPSGVPDPNGAASVPSRRTGAVMRRPNPYTGSFRTVIGGNMAGNFANQTQLMGNGGTIGP